MVKEFEHKNEWALILGGSSGLGLATAKKLAKHGMNICVVHRSSRSQLIQIEEEFSVIKQEGVAFISYNLDATRSKKQKQTDRRLKKRNESG
jgi:enoyl-[acyl-carrier protein] reductase I